MSMVPPGIDFLARALLNFFLPCVTVYPALSIGTSKFLNSDSSRWVLVTSSLGLRLGYILVKPWIQRFRDRRAARANGAVLPPHIKESGWEMAKVLLHDLEDGYPGEPLRILCEKYGTNTLRLTVGMDEVYFTREPAHVKSILATEFESFDKGVEFRSQMESLLGTGVFNTDGEMWKFHRSITRPFFSRDRITDFENFEKHTQEALKIAKARLDEGHSIDFQDLAARFTLDSATEFLFKNDVQSLGAPLPYPPYSPLAEENDSPTFTDHPSNLFVKAFVRSQEGIAQRTTIGSTWPLLEFWKDTVAADRHILDQFVQPLLERGLKEKESRTATESKEDEVPETLLDYLLDKTSDQKVIKDELVNLLVAGRDTTSSLITFSLYMLIEHPEMEQRLRQEIMEKVGSERSPTSEDIRELRYLRAFFERPVNVRTATKPVIVAPSAGSETPLYIPAGKRFIYSVILMQRRKDLWGPDALEFDPDRFLDDRVHKYLVPNPFIFCPFNAGPRICLGQQFAYNEASFFIIRLIQQFTSFTLDEAARLPDAVVPKPEWIGIEGPQGRDRVRFKNTLTMFLRGGLWVQMKEVVLVNDCPRYVSAVPGFTPSSYAETDPPSAERGYSAELGTHLLEYDLPRWVLLASTVGLRLCFVVSRPWINEYRNLKAARERGAVLAPRVKEGPIKVAKSLLNDIKDGYPCETFGRLSNQVGSNVYRLTVGTDELYFTSEPQHVKSILATEFAHFDKGPDSYKTGKSLLGDGVFNTDGEIWKLHRSVTRPFFTKDRISDFDIFERHTQATFAKARARLSEGYPIDFQDLSGRFTLDSATDFLFKSDVRSLDAPLPYPANARVKQPSFDDYPSTAFVKSFATAQEMMASRFQVGTSWPLLEFWKDKIQTHREIIDQFVQPFLEKGLKEKKGRDPESQETSESLLDYLMDKVSGKSLSESHLCLVCSTSTQLINLLVAGRDTTSSLLTFSMYMLIEHPDIEQRLRNEIIEKVGSERNPTSEDIRELKYLRAFLNEVLRLYPIVPLNGRAAMAPVTLAPGKGSDIPIYIPARTSFVYSVYLMHRRKDLWGPDALEFDPDRFLDERVQKHLVHNPFIFCPFNAGPRICLGQQFAYNESSFFLIRLLQKFTSFSLEESAILPEDLPKPEWAGIEGPQGRDRVRFRNGLTLHVRGEDRIKRSSGLLEIVPLATLLYIHLNHHVRGVRSPSTIELVSTSTLNYASSRTWCWLPYSSFVQLSASLYRDLFRFKPLLHSPAGPHFAEMGICYLEPHLEVLLHHTTVVDQVTNIGTLQQPVRTVPSLHLM
ncbi:hypothetical protein NP233_g717 [Leucocoprinus birnbaumii]|uniref:Cytochrome P450 n=1 Tax=Leucocoprinus birnbaumii TaxID=56174 RepID=A0AAD5YWH6_9AGAR|nr:hypothetical protein NP233_g717 [Leucocoprinus birnbaumii]